MTHGLCGKEGAMVFKRVLKGIGRLMLTTAVMCGVGLFLCSSEVKADIGIGLTVSSGDFTVTATGNDSESNICIKGVELYNDSGTSGQPLYKKDGITADSSSYTVNKSDFINGDGFKTSNSSIAGGAPVGIQKVVAIVNYKDNSASVHTDVRVEQIITPAVDSDPIYKVSAVKETGAFPGVGYSPSYKYEVGSNDENRQYGYENEFFKIKHDDSNYTKYYMLVKENTGSNSFDSSDNDWVESSTNVATGSIGTANVLYKVAYLPKVKEKKLVVTGSSNSGSTLSPTGLNIVSNSVNGDTTLTYEIGSFENENENAQKDTILGHYTKSASGTRISNMYSISANPSGSNGCNVTMQLSNIGTTGTGKVKLAIKLGTNDVASAELPITLSAVTATGFELQSDTVTLMAGESKDVSIIKGILPPGANQNLDNYTGSATVTSGNNLIETCTYNNTGGNKTVGTITLKAKSDVTSGTATVEIALTDKTNSTPLGTKPLEVKIISFSKDNTIKSINNSNKNYITYNKDKGYSLDIKQLIIDNAKDSSGNSITIDKKQITEVKVGSTSCSEGTWKPSEAALNQKVSCKINGVKIEESDGLKVSAYPMPTATYSSSNRTLSVKIPTKVATAYSDDNNIRQSKGFKLILEDSSGNTLYEYTDSKYQNVLSSSSESTVTYTVTATDIEGMITSAASNGKFSADTTSVKFKVIPMGYKQSSTSDETIKAKDEIAGKTDAVTVYKVSASGTNFTSSAAYGLDGQTVSITATPNSGYSFKQWSDGNTSNPRQVKVSASGTRSFQAVAGDRVANSTGAGGTDNSELYDDVPKTAESNSAIWLIVFMVFAVMGTTYALYLQLKAANSKHDR